MALKEIFNTKCFGGYQKLFVLKSDELLCDTKFSIYLPPNAGKKNVPVLYWLDHLGSDAETFSQKAGAQRFASENGMCIVCPDTSPRNVNIPELNADDAIGAGAGFYVDAIKGPWFRHFKMHSYITYELINVINNNFPVMPNKQSISGFGMGGHGAIICALKNPGLYTSISALAPILNPINSSYSQKAFNAYFGPFSQGHWQEWDATELVSTYYYHPIEIFIDQGTDEDLYRRKVLRPEYFNDATKKTGRVKATWTLRRGYKNDYYYVASAIQDHIEYHAGFLNCSHSLFDKVLSKCTHKTLTKTSIL